jgi:transcriptional antiterminator
MSRAYVMPPAIVIAVPVGSHPVHVSSSWVLLMTEHAKYTSTRELANVELCTALLLKEYCTAKTLCQRLGVSDSSVRRALGRIAETMDLKRLRGGKYGL